MNKKECQRKSFLGGQQGFTLIEILIVVAIIALLAALVTPGFFGQVDRPKQKEAAAQIELFGEALDLYRLKNHQYPTTDQGLQAVQKYLKKKLPKDPWGFDYVYRSPGEQGEYDLMALGADHAEGGDGNDKDIVSWESFE